MEFELWMFFAIGLLGLVAGTLGGMLGVGGSLIMIPVLVIMFGRDGQTEGFNLHLYQAAAMIVNLFVAIPATLRHRQAGAVMSDVMKQMAPAAVVMIFVGVWVSNLELFREGGGGTVLLGRIFGAFMIYVIVRNIIKLFEPRSKEPRSKEQGAERVSDTVSAGKGFTSGVRCGFVGSAMGFVAGLLGVGGGAIAVPLGQVVLKLKLRNCIANSAATMCITAGFGACYKNASLASHGLNWIDSVTIAAMLAPTAIIGGYLGGRLTHVLPLKVVRAAFVVVLVSAAWKMIGV